MMLDGNNKTLFEQSNAAYDLSNVNALRAKLNSGNSDTLSEAAKQFEAIFVQMMLKSMRQAQDVLADEDSPFNSETVGFYRDMYDTQLADSLSKGGGIGLAALIEQQLGGMQERYTPASVLRSDANPTSLSSQIRQSTGQRAIEQSLAYKAPIFPDKQSFVDALRPHVETAAATLGVDANVLIAQAALETGWGQYVMHDGFGRSANNLFGIKAGRDWQGESVQVDTIEFDGAVANKQKAAFRAYADIAESINDYVKFISQQPRYATALAAPYSPENYAQALQQAGYATDPIYAEKIMSIYRNLGESTTSAQPPSPFLRGD